MNKPGVYLSAGMSIVCKDNEREAVLQLLQRGIDL